jgi:hypothetical protein
MCAEAMKRMGDVVTYPLLGASGESGRVSGRVFIWEG